MCCIFTWMAWCFDASHRIVVFVMACLISSSVCCLLVTASLAGVAMGYNYSLAEYIDLKETNISVYIKRGVYDDEIAEDFDWRRSGSVEPSISVKDNSGLRMGPTVQEGEQPLASGRRRADNSIFESEEQNKYEGGLMRLTSTVAGENARRFEPPVPPYTSMTVSTENLVDGLLEVADSFPAGSRERLRAIQAAAKHHEARKIELATAKIPDDPSDRVKAIETNAQIHNARRNDPSTTTDKYAKYFGQLVQHPGFPGSGLSARKFMESHDKNLEIQSPGNRFRDAVFRGDLSGWPTAGSAPTGANFFEYDIGLTPLVTPPTVKPLLVRPVEGRRPQILWDMPKQESPIKLSKPEIKEYGNNIPRSNTLKDTIPKRGKMYSDYDESHGLPVRKKRSDNQVDAKILKDESNAFLLQTAKVTNYQNYKQENALNADLETSKNIIIKKDEKSMTSKVLHLSSQNNSTPELKILGSNNNNSDVQQSPVISLEQLLSSGKLKNVYFNPKIRWKNTTDYEYENRENKQNKSIWLGISEGVMDQWNKIMFYLNRRTSPILERKSSGKSRIYPNSDTNSSDDDKSTFINKLLAVSTKLAQINEANTTKPSIISISS